MKKLLAFSLIFVPLISRAQNLIDTLPHKNDKILYELVKPEANKIKEVLFINAKKWFNTNPNIKRSTLTADLEQGIVIGKGIFNVFENFEPHRDLTYTFTIQIDCKDNKFRVSMYDVTFIDKDSPYKIIKLAWDYTYTSTTQRQNGYHLDGMFRDMMSSIETRMDKARNTDRESMLDNARPTDF